MPESVGSLEDSPSLLDLYNSERALEIRASILDGSFSYCNQNRCPLIRSGSLPKRSEMMRMNKLIWNGTNVASRRFKNIVREKIINGIAPNFYHLCYDDSCNLTCPSCRSHHIFHNSGVEYKRKKAVQQKILDHLYGERNDSWGILNASGTGDPLASHLYMDLLTNLDMKALPRFSISIQTNGQLFNKKRWSQLRNIHGRVHDVIVSCDAASPETYKLVRRGGSWDTLKANLTFISTLRRNREIKGKFRLDFVVQNRNYKEMKQFVLFAKKLGVDKINFSAVQPYFENSEFTMMEEYQKQAIWKKVHPGFQEFTAILNDPIMDDPLISFGNLTSLRIYGAKREPRKKEPSSFFYHFKRLVERSFAK